MTDHVEMNRRNWDERAAIHARDTTGDYMLDRFRAGEDALHAIEATELGDISGKRVLHLQCHIGRDTLCLVRRGATVTGLDFSSAAPNVAQRLSDETGLKADFVEETVDQAPDLTPGPFDLVFTTWGTICWLPDVKKWAKVIASVLARWAGSFTSQTLIRVLACWKNTLEGLCPPTIFRRLPTGRCSSQMRPRTMATRRSCRINQHESGYTRSRPSSADSLMPDLQLRCSVNTRSCLGGV